MKESLHIVTHLQNMEKELQQQYYHLDMLQKQVTNLTQENIKLYRMNKVLLREANEMESLLIIREQEEINHVR